MDCVSSDQQCKKAYNEAFALDDHIKIHGGLEVMTRLAQIIEMRQAHDVFFDAMMDLMYSGVNDSSITKRDFILMFNDTTSKNINYEEKSNESLYKHYHMKRPREAISEVVDDMTEIGTFHRMKKYNKIEL